MEKQIPEEMINLFVPGRLCLFGEHSDWAGMYRTINHDIEKGLAIVTSTEMGIYAMAEKADLFIMESSPELQENEFWTCEMDSEKLLLAAQQGGFFSYVAGVVSYMCENYAIGGAKITIVKRDLPMKSGLSSSAAICVLISRAFNRLYHLNMSITDEIEAAFIGEQRAGSHCGRMDQSCAYRAGPMLMEFDGMEVGIEPLKVGATFHLVIANLMSSKDTIKILTDLNSAYPFAESEFAEKVQQALGERNKQIISAAVRYIEEGNPEELGKIMDEAQKVFDEMVMPISPELKAPILHSVLNDPNIKKWVYGGKGVGSQGDGSVQFLAKGEKESEALRKYLWDEKRMPSYKHTITQARQVTKAVIPLAGLGTRLFPATRVLKKSLMPLVDTDGILKPLLLILLDRVIASGIREIALVVGKDDIKDIEHLFAPLDAEMLNLLSPEKQLMAARIAEIRKHISFVIQTERKGFGHAVWLTRSFADNDPVLLLLGDFVYQSFIDKNCCKQVMDAYTQSGRTVISISEIPLNKVTDYGVIHGKWITKNRSLMLVDNMVEKPETLYAKKYLGVCDKFEEKNYYATFGQYIITPEVYDALETEIQSGDASDGREINLTNALVKVCHKGGLIGFLPKGRAFDIGNPDAYREAMSCFGKS